MPDLLNFDASRYVAIQSGAVALAPRLNETIGALLRADAPNIFFLGTGGAAMLMQPAAMLLQRESGFPTFSDYSAELVVTGSVNLTEGSIVVVPSLSGTTAESVAMLKAAREAGATVITLVGHEGTPLGQAGDHVFVNFAEDDTSSESFYIQSLLIALSIMNHRGERAGYSQLIDDLAKLPDALLAAKTAFEPQAREMAERLQSADYHLFTGAGNCWPEAHYFGMCILEEMQWIRTRPVHASDFFHGALELVEEGVSLFVLQGEDALRPLTERVIDFASKYTDRVTVLDTASVDMPGIGSPLRPLISPIVLAALLERVSAHLEVLRDHPLTTRRYYRRVAY